MCEIYTCSVGSALLNFFPILSLLPGDMFGAKHLIANTRMVERGFQRPLIDKHVQTYSEDKGDTDYIYAYLRTMDKLKQQGKHTTHGGQCLSLRRIHRQESVTQAYT